jgi:serine/threonine-protein kinase
MSTVFLAEHLRLSRKVAVKVLASELADDDNFRERFVRESRIAAGLDHPNIIPIYEAGEMDGALFIAMRYVDGPSLRRLIDQPGALTPHRLIPIIGQVANALDSAHGRGLVHRDVKPANVLIDTHAGGERHDHAYLCDFGVTKQTTSQTGLTRTGQFLGTIDYIAPEQVEGRDVDARTDLYSLACVAYECLTGSPPFRKDLDAAVLWAHVREGAAPVTDRRSDLPPSIDTVFATAMAKSPDDRYATCGAFVAALRASLAEVRSKDPADARATVSRRAEGLGVLAPGERRDQAPSTTSMSEAAPVPSPPPPLPPLAADRPFTALPQPSRAPVRRGRGPMLALLLVVLAIGGVVGWLLGTTTDEGGAAPPSQPSGEIYREILLSHIPTDVHGTCREVDIDHPGSLREHDVYATAECHPEDIDVVHYRLVHATALMTQALRELVVEHSVDPSTGAARRLSAAAPAEEALDGSDRGVTCDDSTAQVANFWFVGDSDAAHVEHPLRNPANVRGSARGLVACFRDDAGYVIAWTDNQTHIFSMARATQPVALYSWWRDASGPVFEVLAAEDDEHET